jgi:hypothetical protein
MAINYDEKGKFFTNVIAKEAVSAKIQTSTHFIEGEIHVRPGTRVKDELDVNEPFLAVTNARVYQSSGELLFETKFIAIHRDQIVWVTTFKDIAE